MSGQKWWSRDADGTVHPDNSILLAYTRQQQLEQDWQDEIHRHIARCERCQKRCRELRQSSAILEGALLREVRKRPLRPTDERKDEWDWVENPQSAQLAYQSRRRQRQHEDLTLGIALLTHLPFVLLAKAVPALSPYVRKLLASEGQSRNSAMRAVPIIGLPSAMFLVALCIVVVFAYTMVMHNPTGADHPVGTPAVKPPPTIQLTAHPMGTPTVVATSSSKEVTTTTPSSGRTPTISVCSSKYRVQYRLPICGSGFKPGDFVTLIINPNSMWAWTEHPVQVGSAGSFQTFLTIYLCRDVPISIIAKDVQHPSVVSQVLTNIQYGGRCFPNPISTVGHHY